MPIIEIGSINTFVRIKVAGVTHKNGRRGRQTILRQIRWKDGDYKRLDPEDCIRLKLTEYEGEPAVEVWVHSTQAEEMIGYVPREELSFVAPNMAAFDGAYDLEVYGGGQAEDGTRLSYGATFTARFANDRLAVQPPEDIRRREAERRARKEAEEKRREEMAQRATAIRQKTVENRPIIHTATPTYTTGRTKKEEEKPFWTWGCFRVVVVVIVFLLLVIIYNLPKA